MTREQYKEYLLSIQWKIISNEVKLRAKHKCQICSSIETLHAHHNSYEHLGYEMDFMEDLICICIRCHSKCHGDMPVYPPPLPKLTLGAVRNISMYLPTPIEELRHWDQDKVNAVEVGLMKAIREG